MHSTGRFMPMRWPLRLAAQIIHRRTTIIGDRWDRLHPTQQSWYRDMARELLKDVDALMREDRP